MFAFSLLPIPPAQLAFHLKIPLFLFASFATNLAWHLYPFQSWWPCWSMFSSILDCLLMKLSCAIKAMTFPQQLVSLFPWWVNQNDVLLQDIQESHNRLFMFPAMLANTICLSSTRHNHTSRQTAPLTMLITLCLITSCLCDLVTVSWSCHQSLILTHWPTANSHSSFSKNFPFHCHHIAFSWASLEVTL